MFHKYCFVGLLVVALSVSGRSEWVSIKGAASTAAAPKVTLIQDDMNSTVLKVEVSGFEAREFLAEGKLYQSIDLLNEIVTSQPGNPEVPYVAQMLAIPDRGGVSVEVLEMGEVRRFGGYTLPPARPSWQEGAPEPKYVESPLSYASSDAYPQAFTTIDEPVVFRDFRAARVAIHPVRYIAATKEIEVVSSITIRLNYGRGNGINPRTSLKREIPPSFGAVYRNSLVNYESILNRDFGGLETGREVLLCIVPDTFATTFKPYAEWKHKTGTYVKVTKFSEIGATSTNPDIIKNYIAQCYHTWTYPPTFVLLVGDNGQVPKKAADGQSFANEDFFVEIDGSDVFPEMFIGRFTHDVNSNTGLQNIISKVMKYERTPYRANQDWFKHSVVCSNNQYYTQPDTKRWVSDIMKSSGGFTVDTLLNLYNGPCVHNLTEVINAVNNGRSFLNYRGEGSSSGWWASCYPFNTSNVPSVNNGEKFTFVTSIGCGVAMFDASGGNCFGEAWMELGTTANPLGACAFVGPTWGNTHTKYNNAIDKGLYVAMFQEGMQTPSQTLLRGKIRMYNLYGGGDSQVLWHFRTYTVLGDPSTHIWKDVPKKVNITYTTQISIGFNQVEVTVLDSATNAPISGAVVCIAGDSVYATDTTDALGVAFVGVTPMMIDTLTLVVRGTKIVPAEGTVYVFSDQEHIAPLGVPIVADLDGNLDGKVNPNEHVQISYTLKNWGQQPANNVQATLSALDTTYVGIVNVGPVSYGTIAPGASGSASGTPLQFYVKTTTPVGTLIPLRLNVTSATRSWNYATNQQVLGCNLEYVTVTINDQGSPNANGRLDPGETAFMYLTIANTGQDVAPNVVGALRTLDPYLTILDSMGSFGTIPIAGSSANTSNYFVVSASGTTPVASLHNLSVFLTTQNGNYAYSTERTFSVSVGLPSAADPTGPDAYGYYAFSSDDTLYEQAPKFEWFEIRSLGTRIPYVNPGDFTTTATLPFTFKYYGRNFTSLRMSSDGWIAFGSGTQTSYNNTTLPSVDNIRNMLGLFWDDLFEPSNDPTSKLLYYNDATNHRFIVEWDSVGHYNGTTLRESFQAILFDPAFYPTPTGDGEIVFQYRVVGEEGGCTIGIEDSTQTIGMQYLLNGTYNTTASEIRDSYSIKYTTEPPSIASTSTTVSVLIGSGWNLISNPVIRQEALDSVRQLFPNTLTNYVFKFTPAGYSQTVVMPNGLGYWGKFPGGELNPITGTRILSDSIPVNPGWNIIGSISGPLDTSAISTIPPGLRTSNYFGYSSGYAPVSIIAPGQGYWVKANSAGQFVLGSSSLVSMLKAVSPKAGAQGGLSSMTISDSRGGSQTLYFGSATGDAVPLSMFDMPPLPPTGAFDARFESAEGGTMMKLHADHTEDVVEFPVRIQSTAYPLVVSWNIVGGGTYELTDGPGSHRLPARSLSGTGSLKIESDEIQKLTLRVVGSDGLPVEYALSQNYPNPFNPSTTLKYALPVQSRVTAEVFNVLGQRVKTLVNEERKAGYYEVVWHGTGDAGLEVGSGVYFIRLNANGGAGNVFSAVRKVLFMK